MSILNRFPIVSGRTIEPRQRCSRRHDECDVAVSDFVEFYFDAQNVVTIPDQLMLATVTT